MQSFDPTANMVMCRKYQQNLPKMPHPPFPNKLGETIQQTVSQKAWTEWTDLQTMLINEKHLSMINPEAKQFINEQREKFLDNQEHERPTGWTSAQ